MKSVSVAVLLLLVLDSCSPSGTSSKTETYTDEQLALRISHPAGWKRIKAGGSVKLMLSGGPNRQITIADELGDEKEIAAALEHFRKSVPNYREFQGGWIDLNGQRAYLQTISWNTPLGDNKAVRLYVPAGVHFFVVTAMAPLAEFDRYASLFRDCALSFERLH